MNTSNSAIRIRIALLVCLASIFAACSENNPVTPEEHFEARGLTLKANGLEIVRVDSGRVVSGSITVDHGALSPHFRLTFIKEDGTLGLPGDPDLIPVAEIADTTIAQVVRDAPGDWDFHIRGLRDGETTISIGIRHGSHNDFISPPITLTVSDDEHNDSLEAHGLVLRMNGVELLRQDEHGTVTGPGISMAAGTTTDHIALTFLNASGNEFIPVEEHLAAEITTLDTTIADVERPTGEKWDFEIIGRKAGTTTLRIRLKHGSDVEFEASSIPVTVIP